LVPPDFSRKILFFPRPPVKPFVVVSLFFDRRLQFSLSLSAALNERLLSALTFPVSPPCCFWSPLDGGHQCSGPGLWLEVIILRPTLLLRRDRASLFPTVFPLLTGRTVFSHRHSFVRITVSPRFLMLCPGLLSSPTHRSLRDSLLLPSPLVFCPHCSPASPPRSGMTPFQSKRRLLNLFFSMSPRLCFHKSCVVRQSLVVAVSSPSFSG